ncbi:hypothetical protein K443DRAFT_579248 [Laccaria amethystina LaAM-08-1]|uniref:Uncharacterized protein n=1 Tax=Laccaria amethystina LaAM-08-1 TaxID=1095629 RepID=A0A0C9WRD5_9AGAR|nr:hypothetical protein K443DRAFT_579248 [Laccaria amethystina LaAM-08-1]
MRSCEWHSREISRGAVSRPYRPSDPTSDVLDFLEFNGSRHTSVFASMGDLWFTHYNHAAVGGHNTMQAAPRAEGP